jgi:uncharacterized protein YcfJ
MKSKLIPCVIALLVAAAPISVHALGKNEKGCLVGGAVGGVGGHLLGSGSTTNTVVGAVAGCAVGTVVAKERAEKDGDAKARQRAKVARYSQRREYQPIRDRDLPRS